MKQFLSGMMAGAGLVAAGVFLAPVADRVMGEQQRSAPTLQVSAVPRFAQFVEVPAWHDMQLLGNLAAQMEREMAAMAEALPNPEPDMHTALWGDLGSAAAAATLVSQLDGTCIRSVEIRQTSGQSKPDIVSKTSGNCAQDTSALPAQPRASDDQALTIRASYPVR